MGDFNSGRDIFDGVEGASMSKTGIYLSPGYYPELTIKSFIAQTGKKDGVIRLILEVDVTADPIYSPTDLAAHARARDEFGQTKGCQPLLRGQEATYMLDMSKMGPDGKPANLGKLNNLAGAIRSDLKPEQVTKPVIYDLIGPTQPAAGIVIRAKAVGILTQKKGEPYTVIEFSSAL